MNRIVLSLIPKIRANNKIAVESAKSFVVAVLACGAELKILRAQCAHGEWLPALKETGISETTARIYMDCAEAAAESGKKRVAWLIDNCSSLAELLRCLGLAKPCEVGGYKSEVYQRRKLTGQLELDFSYKEALPHLESLLRAKNVEELKPSTRRSLLEIAKAIVERLSSTVQDDSAIPLTPDHQP